MPKTNPKQRLPYKLQTDSKIALWNQLQVPETFIRKGVPTTHFQTLQTHEDQDTFHIDQVMSVIPRKEVDNMLWKSLNGWEVLDRTNYSSSIFFEITVFLGKNVNFAAIKSSSLPVKSYSVFRNDKVYTCTRNLLNDDKIRIQMVTNKNKVFRQQQRRFGDRKAPMQQLTENSYSLVQFSAG